MKRLAAGAALLAFAVLVPASPVPAQTSVVAGWWWRGNPGAVAPTPPGTPTIGLPTVPPAAPVPPNVGPTDLMVAATPDGPSAIAAVALGESATSLKLDVTEDGDNGGAAAVLQACTPVGTWNPAVAGRWDDKPVCSPSAPVVAGKRSEDGLSWTFSLAALSTEDGTNVVIVPAPSAPGGPYPPFQLVFKAPTVASFETSSLGSSDFSFDGGAGSEFASEDFDATDVGPAPGAFDTGVGSDFALPETTFAAPPAPGVGTPTPQARVPSQPARPTANVAAPTSSGTRVLGMLVVLGMLAAAYAVTRLPVPALMNLARPGEPVATPGVDPAKSVGGLGRFARPRQGRPPELR